MFRLKSGELTPLSPLVGATSGDTGGAAVEVEVANTGDRPVQVGSHYHFAETNPALSFDRAAARGRRLVAANLAGGVVAVEQKLGPAPVQLGQVLLLVVHRKDDRDESFVGVHHDEPLSDVEADAWHVLTIKPNGLLAEATKSWWRTR